MFELLNKSKLRYIRINQMAIVAEIQSSNSYSRLISNPRDRVTTKSHLIYRRTFFHLPALACILRGCRCWATTTGMMTIYDDAEEECPARILSIPHIFPPLSYIVGKYWSGIRKERGRKRKKSGLADWLWVSRRSFKCCKR